LEKQKERKCERKKERIGEKRYKSNCVKYCKYTEREKYRQIGIGRRKYQHIAKGGKMQFFGLTGGESPT
jgi:hypothetical protein